MKLSKAFIDSIQIGQRHRRVDPEKVKSLTESIRQIGLQNPIHIFSPDEDTCEIVAGVHRYEAVKSLGEVMIDCFLVDLDEVDRELWEIDENLMRAELTPAQEADHLKRRKVLFDLKAEQFVQPSGQKSGFSKDVSEKTGQTQQDVNRKISRASNIAPEVLDEITGTEMDKGVELDALKGMSPDEQRQDLNYSPRLPKTVVPQPKQVLA